MVSGHFEHFCNGVACKDKWGSLYGDYKKINDFRSVTSHNENYWEMSIEDKLAQGLPKNFNKLYFDLIHDFMHSRPCFNPLHSRDFMDPKDDI